MKTTVYSILAAGLVLSVVCACNRESYDIPAPVQKITVTASLPADATKVAAADREEGTGLSWNWEEGDAITLIGKTVSVLSIDEGFTAKKATFSGSPVKGDSFIILYPGTITTIAGLEALSFAEQSQKTVSDKEHLKYFAMLQNLTAFDNFEFSQAWAQANEASLKQCGVLKIATVFPSELEIGSVGRITLKASAPIFHAGNGDTMTDALTLAFEDGTLPEGKAITAWLNTSWYDDVIPEGTALQAIVAAGDLNLVSDIALDGEKTLRSGAVNVLSIPAESWYAEGRYSGGSGTAMSPWVITKPEQMLYIKEDLVDGETRYFRLGADIDMSGIEDWTPLNAASPYAKAIDFNGAGHVISNFKCSASSYPSFFGVLNGACHDVTFTDALIECTADSGCGILGGYGGSGDLHADVYRVHVHGKVNFSGNKTGIGGMFGCAGNATIEASSADVDVYSPKNYVGGMVGYSKKLQIRNCWTAGSVRGDQRVGGIVGGINGDGDEIINSYSITKLYIIKDEEKEYAATRSVGGIVAHANQDKGDANETREPGNIVQGCIAWQDELKTRTYVGETTNNGETVADYYSSGAIVAFGATHNTYADCYRKASLDFRDYAGSFLLYDQENTSAASPLVVKPVEGCAHNYPYHGKAAPAGATLTQVAQSLGWSTAIWDFSGDVPTILPNADAGPAPIVPSEGQLPGFGDNDIN